MTRRYLHLCAALSLLIATTTPAIAATSIKPNAACSKLNLSVISAGVKYQCIKVGNKLIWKAQSKVAPTPTPIPTSTPSPTPTPTPSPTSTPKPTPAPTSKPTPAPFKAKIPITLPITQSGIITFENVLNHVSEIPQVAWQRVQDVIASNPEPAPITNTIHVGPNTKLDVAGGIPRIQELLQRNEKLWSGFTQVKNFFLLAYNAKDEKWAEEDWKSIGKAGNYFQGVITSEVERIAGNCQQTVSPGVFSGDATDCRGADSTAISNTDDAVLTIGQGGNGASNDTFATEGGIYGHEYVHSVQAAQWIGNPISYCTEQSQTNECFRSWSSNWGFSPCWLFEGLPNSSGPIVAYGNLQKYLDFRKNLPYSQGPTTVTDYSQSSLRDYLFNQSSSTCYSNGPLYRLGYTVGALAVETLIAIGGPQSAMALFSLGAEGQDFTSAFKNVYGISWDEASTILSKVLAAEYATFGPPPK